MKRTTSVKYAAAALAGTAVLAACGTESGSGSGSVGDGEKTKKATDIADTRWVPQKVTVDGKEYGLPTEDKHFRVDQAYVVLKPGAAEPDVSGGDSGGTVGCNDFGADVEIEGDTVKITDLASTAMGCPGPVQEFEERFLSVFTGTLKAAVEEREGAKTLTLTSKDGDSITLGEGAAKDEPEPALKGTKWTIDTLVSGKGDDSTAKSLPKGTKAHLTLGEDGTASGNLGCNNFRGEAAVKNGTIEFGRLSTTRMLCEGPVMKAEQEMIDILTGKVSYQQKDQTLTLTKASGDGLVAHAK
ncbi:lipoprotein [Streptomyces davaonensis JCM 4913]|uniref:Lipoprotein n=1 Tax=Streptomyces davaonensis (strain DSM 101723 / JCM 4913 / KCC S-0913 / 768) TaxID=1214101 RepID=K4R6T7_STRDJ|nr:META domain-containing protein [Streptomyces davaonensis]CCK29078.1 lipoprotein [Streptomyces davaonensis JCM 4913]